MELPDALVAAGLTSRPMTYDDAQAVFEVIVRQERHDSGNVEIELADIVSDWQRPSFNPADSTVAVLDGEDLIGYAEVMGGQRGDAAVDPAYRGRGVGTFLAHWMQDTARRHGYSWIRMPVLQGSAADLLLEALGYRVAWTGWLLDLPEDVEVEPRPLPAGYAVRSAVPDDYSVVWTLLEDAFLEWDDRDRDSFEDFLAETRDRPGFERWNVRVVTDPDAQVVAAAIIRLSEPGESNEPRRSIPRQGRRAPRSPWAGHRPGPVGRFLPRGSRAWRGEVWPVDGLTHGGARPLREGWYEGFVSMGQPGHRSLAKRESQFG